MIDQSDTSPHLHACERRSTSISRPPSVAVLLTCHNRADTTLRCLRELFRQRPCDAFIIRVFVVDAGSTDGTADRISVEWPEVTVIRRDASLYWNGGMRVAFEAAIAERFDYYLWLNDDTLLHPDAVSRLLDTAIETRRCDKRAAIIVGVLADPATGKTSYGGWKSESMRNRAKVTKLERSSHATQCDTMNGNCVLIPQSVVEQIGNLDPCFTHGMGDMDYGFRAIDAGFSIWTAPGFCGECPPNSGKGLWIDRSLKWSDRMRRLLGVKGLPLGEWLMFTRRYSGFLWPLYWASPYVKLLLEGMLGSLRPQFRHGKTG